MHLQKTGGTTFIGHLYSHLKFDEEIVSLNEIGLLYRRKHNRKDLDRRNKKELDKVKIVTGHNLKWGIHKLFPDREPRYVIFIREPISRLISYYTFDNSINYIPFDDWYGKTWTANHMYKFLCENLGVDSVKAVKERLSQFWHIGFTDSLDNSLKYIFKELDIDLNYQNRRVSGETKNSTKDFGYDTKRIVRPKYTPLKSEMMRIKNDHVIDLKLYREIKKSVKNGIPI